MKRILTFFKQETVLCIACLLALISAFIIPPDADYASYIDFRTLFILFCLMTVMAGLQGIGLFRMMAQTMLSKVRNMRQLVPILILLCFFSSMVMTNDVALITFVPFTFIVLDLAGEGKKASHAIPIVVMQTIAANLGSMLTPIGNPQNLYLYETAKLPLPDFLLLMLPYTAASGILLILWSIWYTRKDSASLTVAFTEKAAVSSQKKLILYLILFVLSLLTVAHVVHELVTLAAVILTVLIMDRHVLRRVDYSLLATFAGFFIFIGNMGRIPAFCTLLEAMIAGHETITAIASSQIISNVPAALLLSGFTEEYTSLIIGTNLGGLGTLIASMASLISFKAIGRELPSVKGNYLGAFTLWNLVFLAVLMALYFFIA